MDIADGLELVLSVGQEQHVLADGENGVWAGLGVGRGGAELGGRGGVEREGLDGEGGGAVHIRRPRRVQPRTSRIQNPGPGGQYQWMPLCDRLTPTGFVDSCSAACSAARFCHGAVAPAASPLGTLLSSWSLCLRWPRQLDNLCGRRPLPP